MSIPVTTVVPSQSKKPYPFWLGGKSQVVLSYVVLNDLSSFTGLAATIAASITQYAADLYSMGLDP